MKKNLKSYATKQEILDDEKILKNKYKEIIKMQNIIIENQRKSERLQRKFNFKIPDYVIEELIKDNKDYDVLNSMICVAIANNRLSKENAQILKRLYMP